MMDEYQQKLMAIIEKAKAEKDEGTYNKANIKLNEYMQQKGGAQAPAPQPQEEQGFDVGEFMSGGISPEASVKRRQMLTDSAGDNIGYPTVKGLGFGYGDEALAGMLATFAAIKGDIKPNQVGEMYESIRSEIGKASDNYSEENPVKGFAAEVVPSAGAGIASEGALMGVKIPSIIKKLREGGILSAGALGAFEAFIYGSGQGESLEPGQNITPEIPFLGGHMGDTTYEGKLEDPYLNQIVADLGGRALAGVDEIPLGFAGGVAGARIGDAISTGFKNKAAAKKMTREGFEDPESARYALADPTQKRPLEMPEGEMPPMGQPEAPQMADEFVIDQVDQSPGLQGIADEGFAADMPKPKMDVEPEMSFEQDPKEMIPQPPEGFMENASELMSPFKEKLIKPGAAKAALHQDVNPNMLTNIREANKPTLEALGELTNTFQRYKKTDALGSRSPYKLIGQEFDKRLKTVLEKNKEAMSLQRDARKTLEDVEGVQLKDVASNVFDTMQEQFAELGIKADDAVLDFSGIAESSPLKKPASQKFLQSVWTDFLGANNAAKLHDLRRNIDLEINYNKANMTSFDSETNKILKKIRGSIKENLDQFSPEYAEANRVLSQNLKALENLEQAFPQLKSQYNLDDPDDYAAALEYVGQQLRLLDSNAAAAPKIERSIIQFNRLAEEYGGKFDVDISKMVRHHNLLKRQFGDKAQSIGGIFDATGDKIINSLKTNKGQRIQQGKEILNPLLGKNEDNAYQSIQDYISEITKTHNTKGAK
ncbi:MAG TPA: hypothetical protein VMV86_07045 [Methanosarcinales archaeon]|nr:hypothetical protein [Methanosarcinales archaeon]